eukprot:gene4226-4097_t
MPTRAERWAALLDPDPPAGGLAVQPLPLPRRCIRPTALA